MALFPWQLYMTMHNTVSSMFDRSCGILWILICFFSSPYFPHHSSFVGPKIFFQNRAGCFRCFQEKSNLSFLFLNINQCFSPCCKLCLYSWRHLMIAYLHLSWLHDSDIPTTLGVLLTWLDVVALFFLKMEIILSSCAFIIFFHVSMFAFWCWWAIQCNQHTYSFCYL